MNVENVLPNDFAEMLCVWESSVRATHDFLTEEDIEFFKPIIMEQAFPAVTLRCVKDDNDEILGFVGEPRLETSSARLVVNDSTRMSRLGDDHHGCV